MEIHQTMIFFFHESLSQRRHREGLFESRYFNNQDINDSISTKSFPLLV